MARQPQLNYDIVESFLKGELDLAQLDEGKLCTNATRMLIVQAIIIANPDKYLTEPFKNMILQEGLKDILQEVFPKHRSSIADASRRQDLHSSSRRDHAKIKIQAPDELHALVEKYAGSTVLADVMAPILERRTAIARRIAEEQERTESQAAAVVEVVRQVLQACDNPAQLVAVVRQLRKQCAKQGKDTCTNPALQPSLYRPKLETAIRRQLRLR